MKLQSVYPDGNPDNPAVSSVISIILIVLLVFTLTAIIYAFIFGLISPVEKTAYVAVNASLEDMGTGSEVISVFHENGDGMEYENLISDPNYELILMVDTSEGISSVKTDPDLLSDTIWSPGDTLYIFRRSDGYVFTDDPVLLIGTIPFPPGSISVTVIDNTHHQLVAFREPRSA